MKKKLFKILIFIVFLIVFGWISSFLDVTIANFFYISSHPLTAYGQWIYKYVEWISVAIAMLSACVVLASYRLKSILFLKKSALVMLLSLLVAVGLIEGVLKQVWKRPRPYQVVEYGGKEPYQPWYVYRPTKNMELTSFPSGHVAMGCYYISLIYVGMMLRSYPVIVAGWVFTLFFGITTTWIRLSQGGHFLSDAIVSCLIMWGIAKLSTAFIFKTTCIDQIEKKLHLQSTSSSKDSSFLPLNK